MRWMLLVLFGIVFTISHSAWAVDDSSPLIEKAKFLEKVLVDKHSLDGLYISIIDSVPAGTKAEHTVNQSGNVIHSGVWTRSVFGWCGLSICGHERPEGARARWHDFEGASDPARGDRKARTAGSWLCQRTRSCRRLGTQRSRFQGVRIKGKVAYADYRFYGDVSVDNFNSVLYGYAIFHDLAADEEQKKYIAYDVDRLMTHLLDNHCRIHRPGWRADAVWSCGRRPRSGS